MRTKHSTAMQNFGVLDIFLDDFDSEDTVMCEAPVTGIRPVLHLVEDEDMDEVTKVYSPNELELLKLLCTILE